jgi:hypothetical protein
MPSGRVSSLQRTEHCGINDARAGRHPMSDQCRTDVGALFDARRLVGVSHHAKRNSVLGAVSSFTEADTVLTVTKR